METKFLYPSSMLKTTRVDEHFENEVELLDERPVLYSEVEDRLVLRGESIEGTTIIYRGWILTPAVYSRINELVVTAGGKMLVSPDAYSHSQFAEGWLDVFKNLTPDTISYPYTTEAEIIGQDFIDSTSSYVVKGSSKSLKHDWANSMFAETGSDVSRIVSNFKNQVSENEESTILVRKFENWLPGELRVWWLKDQFIVDQHPNNESDVDFGVEFEQFLNNVVKSKVVELDAVFVSTDFVCDEMNSFRLVEVGNGQVSGASDLKKILELFN